MTTVLSVQSAVAYGHVGNSAAVFPLQRLGVEVWPVNTVHFSNHTAYPSWRGPLMSAADVTDVVRGIGERGVLVRADALLCGYLGAPEVGQAILDTARMIREANPAAVFCADPVMGDVDAGFYAAPGIPEFWRDRVVPVADLLTPNLFELEFLTGRALTTLDDVVAAARALRDLGPGVVLVTSVTTDDMPGDASRMVAVDGAGAWLVGTPHLDRVFTGSGDLTSAMFLAHWLPQRDVRAALEATSSIVYSVLEATTAAGDSELRLVAAQQDLVSPRFHFTAQPLG
ncbi:pyridoxal kinase PdxY [Tessaracoccus defluvii]|uniref:pyridoxal kinase PdxY n=3 Tax=Tessaracoccus defluvii TaxID=1285901 RepID=UPI0031DB6E3F